MEKGNISKSIVLEQKNNLQGWKEDSIVSYGQRWIVDRNRFLLYKENV
jgi:hypothetical protein